MQFVAYGCLIVLGAACAGLVGHSFINSFFTRKEELIKRLTVDMEKDINA